jgi:hypothetical protein
MNRHARIDPIAQPDLFGPAPQGDLFGAPPPFRPAPAHVVSGLERLHERLASAQDWWGFTDWDIERFRNREPAYYCGLLDDAALAQDWRARLDGEIARLDAASGPVRPE